MKYKEFLFTNSYKKVQKNKVDMNKVIDELEELLKATKGSATKKRRGKARKDMNKTPRQRTQKGRVQTGSWWYKSHWLEEKQRLRKRVVKIINKLMWLASVCTSVAFMASSYIMVGRKHEWAAIFVAVVGGVIMVGVFGTMTYYVVKSRRTRTKRESKEFEDEWVQYMHCDGLNLMYWWILEKLESWTWIKSPR